MNHLKRVLVVAVALIAAGGSSVLASPAAQHFLTNHPADAGYITLAAGALAAAYRAWKITQTPKPPPAPQSTVVETAKPPA